MRNALVVAAVGMFCMMACGEAWARGGMGQGMRMRDGSCMTGAGSVQQPRRQMQECPCMTTGASRQDAGQGQMRRLGPGDGTGNVTRPQDGTGFGAPSASSTTR